MLYLVLTLAVGMPPFSLATPTCKIEKTRPNHWTIGDKRFDVDEEKSDYLRQVRDKTKSFAQSAPFLSTTGGIAFEGIAVPALDLKEQPVQLDYEPDQPDGQRLSIAIGDKTYHPFLPDWKLIPIARYANSEFTSAVSALNSPENQSYADLLYHPAFEDTLLGFRLLQMDILLNDVKAFQELPKNSSGEIITGVGEPKNVFSRQSWYKRWKRWKRAAQVFSGYLKNNDKRFGADAKLLMPSLLEETDEKLWKRTQEAFSTSIEEYNFKFPARLISIYPSIISNEKDWENARISFLNSSEGRRVASILRTNEPSINNDDDVWQAAVSSSLHLFQEWFLGYYLQTITDIDELQSYVAFLIRFTRSVDGGALIITDSKVEVQFSADENSFQLTGFPYHYFWEKPEQFKKLKKEAEDCQQETDLEAAVRCGAKLQQYYDSLEAVPKTHLIQLVKEQRKLIRAFNPTVYDATVQTMRYAAFFRYVKHNNKDSWEKFLRQLESVKVTPIVRTPTRWKR